MDPTIRPGAREHPWKQWKRLEKFFTTGQARMYGRMWPVPVARSGHAIKMFECFDAFWAHAIFVVEGLGRCVRRRGMVHKPPRHRTSFFATGQVCIIDGANGTEIQKRGGKPAETFSSGTAAIMRPDLCQEVHEAYLESGADIIMTHTYSANRNVMTPSGNGDRSTECILAAAAIARRATAVHAAKHAAKLAHLAAAAHASAAQVGHRLCLAYGMAYGKADDR